MAELADELRELSREDLLAELDDAKEELFNLRFQLESGRLEDFSQIKRIRRGAARILTIMRERELVAEMVVEEEVSE